ncbi:putative DNA-binding transcriptional regulator YafY [Asanoa ferruginea]|uniref:Putative DNA-binding transcriptional regulator YafY n=1 Tax=Asanoa ferruginea TaxID=53367 RepID=A0A3D9ZMZ4_9ACTN|nr:YafY family protein [Asanoa ferruginea]REF98738.1 putative DNA-binding transcriptional regulator YafY [Asanoa ferruginea]GIF49479.1 transcriptional regulator [Asanoa ferruginea]
MSHPASRVLGMLELLQTHHHLTGADLGARLGVDERTVRRYATTLADLGIPVTAARGRYGGYRLSPGYKLPPLMLTDDEAAAVVLGLIAAEHLGLTTEAPATGPALAKISRVLPKNLAERLAGVQENLGFTVNRSATAARPATTTLLALGAAARATRRVSITYRSWRGAVSLRDVDPYGLVFHAGRWYLTGFDHRRGEVRTFRLDRIAAVDTGEATFTVPEGFDPVGHVTRSLAGVPYTWEVEVLFEADQAQVRRRVPASVAEITETADGVLMRARAQSLPGMAQMLAGLGWPFRIVGPPELRDAVRAHGERLIQHAAR